MYLLFYKGWCITYNTPQLEGIIFHLFIFNHISQSCKSEAGSADVPFCSLLGDNWKSNQGMRCTISRILPFFIHSGIKSLCMQIRAGASVCYLHDTLCICSCSRWCIFLYTSPYLNCHAVHPSKYAAARNRDNFYYYLSDRMYENDIFCCCVLAHILFFWLLFWIWQTLDAAQ